MERRYSESKDSRELAFAGQEFLFRFSDLRSDGGLLRKSNSADYPRNRVEIAIDLRSQLLQPAKLEVLGGLPLGSCPQPPPGYIGYSLN